MENIYVFGHKNPDTDSICASISLAYLKNKLGYNVVPKVLGKPNNETKFVLEKFDTEEPEYLNDVKLQIKNINYQKDYCCNVNNSIYDGFTLMHNSPITTLPITDDENNLYGIVSMKDIAKYQMSEDLNELNTSYQNIIDVLCAEEIVRNDEEIKGEILIASYRSTTFMQNINIKEDTILIVGDRHSIIEYAINNKAKLLILTGNAQIHDEHIELAKKNHVNIIRTDKDTFTIAKKVWLSNYLKNICLTSNIITYTEDDYVDEFINDLKNNKYSNYPILDKNQKYLGLLRAANINDVNKKKVILVDHNQLAQSAEGLSEAEILEIVDHHNLGTIGTSLPISFRTMPVGCTCTIIYKLYQESGIEIPKTIAGLMLSAILSDTMIFKSPTTTEIDKNVAYELAKITGLDIDSYGYEMFKAGSSIKGMTADDILNMDIKSYKVKDDEISIAQVFTMDYEEIKKDIDQYISLLDNLHTNGNKVATLFITDVIKNGSYLICNNKAKDIMKEAFNLNDFHQGYYLDNVVSRKKQMFCNIFNALEKII